MDVVGYALASSLEEFIGGNFAEKTALPSYSSNAQAVYYNGKIYVTVGYLSYDFYEYNISTEVWTKKARMLTNTFSYGTLAIDTINGKIYAMNTSASNNKTQVYDIATNVWTYLADDSIPRQYACSVFYNNKVYTFGGRVSDVASSQIRIYDIATNSFFTSSVTLGQARYTARSIICNDKVYIFGGFYGTVPSNYAEYFDLTYNTITALATMPTAKYWSGIGIIEKNIYLFGGLTSGTTQTNEVARYSITNNSYSIDKQLPYYTEGISGSAQDNSNIYLFSSKTQVFKTGINKFKALKAWLATR